MVYCTSHSGNTSCCSAQATGKTALSTVRSFPANDIVTAAATGTELSFAAEGGAQWVCFSWEAEANKRPGTHGKSPTWTVTSCSRNPTCNVLTAPRLSAASNLAICEHGSVKICTWWWQTKAGRVKPHYFRFQGTVEKKKVKLSNGPK